MSSAIAILKKAQAILLGRLSDYLIENEDDYLESLTNATDLGMHTQVYELADKLRDLSVVASIMPNEPEPANHSQVQVVESEGGMVVEIAPVLTYGSFISYVELGNFQAATAVLAHLFQLGVGRANDCTRYFANKWATDPEIYFKALTVPSALQSLNSETTTLLHELFDLTGAEIASVYRVTKQTIGPPT